MVCPIIVSFEGLNRSGKGTQISLLKEYLQSCRSDVVVMRGHGSRKGNATLNDPFSSWWQDLQRSLRKINGQQQLSIYPWIGASDMLNWELYEKFHEYLDGEAPLYILLDRSLISHYIMLSREGLASSIDDVTSFYDPSGVKRSCIFPDISFVFHVDQKTLLRRNMVKADEPEKSAFRKRNIIKSYETYEHLTRSLDYDLLNIVHLDGNQGIEDVSCKVIDTLRSGGYII